MLDLLWSEHMFGCGVEMPQRPLHVIVSSYPTYSSHSASLCLFLISFLIEYGIFRCEPIEWWRAHEHEYKIWNKITKEKRNKNTQRIQSRIIPFNSPGFLLCFFFLLVKHSISLLVLFYRTIYKFSQCLIASSFLPAQSWTDCDLPRGLWIMRAARSIR